MFSLRLLVTCFAVALSLFQLYTSIFGSLEPLMQRLVFIGLAFIIIFLQAPAGEKPAAKAGRCLALVFTLIYLGYYLVNYNYLSAVRFPYISELNAVQVVLGAGMLLATLEACRRTVGLSLSLVAVGALLYALVGRHLPGIFYHQGFGWSAMIDNLVYTTDGVLGVALAVTATYVVLFVIFGVFLSYAGFGDFLLNLCLGVAGRLRGGAGKIAILATGLMGMINGSATANALAVGSFTLPVMLKAGYDKEFAAGAVALGGSGGQLMPPIMGAQAFLMTQFTGIPYILIAKFSFFPAVFYYLGIWMGLDVEARRKGLGALSSQQLGGDWRRAVLSRLHLVLPIALLVFLLVRGYTLMFAGAYSILAVVAVSFLRPETRLTPQRLFKALEEGALLSVAVVAAAATAGVIIGMVTLTGLGERFSLSLLNLAGGNLFLALVFTALASIVLGMGLPTIPAYLIQVSLIIPALIRLGLTVPVAHLFAIYFACLSMVTPPVAINAYATAGLVGANAFRTGWKGFRLGLVSYVVPFVFVYYPGILLIGPWSSILSDLLRMLVICAAMTLAIGGYWERQLSLWQRAACAAAVVVLFPYSLILNLTGLALFLLVLVYQRWGRTQTLPARS